MSIILHLSDLHLRPEHDEPMGDHKIDLVEPEERINRTPLLQNSLEELGRFLSRRGQQLDAVVVSGDITDRGRESGFKLLPQTLATLGDAKPNDDRIVVVPGNHDVAWRTPSSTPGRYANFIRHVRSRGYITPLLDGIDFTSGPTEVSFDGHYLLDLENRWLILPINSCNYCGLLQNVELDEEAERPKEDSRVRRVLDELRLHDAVRVSPEQFRFLRQMLINIDRSLSERGVDPATVLRVAVLHHHLGPVSTEEEVKTFESFINLGHLRHFLRRNRIDVVLHGHKHTGYIYWDHVYDMPRAYQGDDHRVLVISGSTLSGTDYRREEVARLIDIFPRRYAPAIKIARVPAVDPGVPHRSFYWRPFSLWSPYAPEHVRSAPPTVIRSSTLSQVYAQVLGLFENNFENEDTARIPNLTCQIEDPSTAHSLPEGYPEITNVEPSQRQEWFDDVVSWWQLPTTFFGDRVQFTHGTRIAWHNQYQRIVQALRDGFEGRAIATLLDPARDIIDGTNRSFPAFCLVQFEIRHVADARYLDCVAYFRRQEMRYWWPINMGELSTLQRRLHEEVAPALHGLRRGAITTVSAVAYVGKQPTVVAVPAIDRAVEHEDSRKDLWSMGYSLFWEAMPNRSIQAQRWARVLKQLEPPPRPQEGGIPLAVEGVNYLYGVIQRFALHHSDSRDAIQVGEHLDGIYRENLDYLRTVADRRVTTEYHAAWRRRVARDVGGIRILLRRIYAEDADEFA